MEAGSPLAADAHLRGPRRQGPPPPPAPEPPPPPSPDDDFFSAFLQDSLEEEEEISGLSDFEQEFGGAAERKTGAAAAADTGLDGYTAGSEKKRGKEEDVSGLGRGAQIGRMNVSQRIRLALLGNKTDRGILIRDANRMVSISVIKSPKVTPQEASAYAMMRSLSDDVIRYIAGKRDWMKSYQVKLALCRNPKTPPATSMRLLSHLRKPDLRAVSTDRNVAHVVSMTAKQMVKGQRAPR